MSSGGGTLLDSKGNEERVGEEEKQEAHEAIIGGEKVSPVVDLYNAKGRKKPHRVKRQKKREQTCTRHARGPWLDKSNPVFQAQD